MGFLDRISDEQLYFLVCLVTFVGLVLAIYLGNELLEWTARRREEATTRKLWNKFKKENEPRKRLSSCEFYIEKRSFNDLLRCHVGVKHDSRITTK